MSDFIEKIILPSLTAAQDFAYIEDAAGTYEMLNLIEQVLRYSLHNKDKVFLKVEVNILKATLNLLRYRFGNFQFILKCDQNYDDVQINKYQILQQATPIIDALQSTMNQYHQLNLEIIHDYETNTFVLKVGDKR
jgi:hypothetical protein